MMKCIKGNIFHKELVLLYKGLYLASISLNFAFTPFSYKIRFMAKKLQFEVLMAQISSDIAKPARETGFLFSCDNAAEGCLAVLCL